MTVELSLEELKEISEWYAIASDETYVDHSTSERINFLLCLLHKLGIEPEEIDTKTDSEWRDIWQKTFKQEHEGLSEDEYYYSTHYPSEPNALPVDRMCHIAHYCLDVCYDEAAHDLVLDTWNIAVGKERRRR